MTNEQLQKISDLMIKEVFDSIPKIPCCFETLKSGTEGCFRLAENDEDDLKKEDPELFEMIENAPEYRIRHIALDDTIGIDLFKEMPWTDPMRHPNISINVNSSLKKDIRRVVAALMHELTHYWCWYVGHDFGDGNKQFEKKLKELDLPSCYDREFKNGTYVSTYDLSKTDKYLALIEEAGIL